MRFFLSVISFSILGMVVTDHLKERINEALCKLQCYNGTMPPCTFQTKTTCDCPIDLLKPDSFGYEKYAKRDLTLKCKAEDMFHVEWENDINPYDIQGEDNTAYFLHVENSNEEFFTDVTFCNYYTIDKAQANVTYFITLWGVDDESRVFLSKALEVDTSERGSIPLPVTNISLNLLPDVSNYQATIKWTPAKDLSCYYEVILYCTSSGNIHDTIPAPDSFEIIEPTELFQLHIDELHFGYSYALTVRAKSAKFENESSNKTIHFNIPTCLNTFKNLTICGPDQPQNFTVKEILVSDENEEMSNIYDVFLNWAKPELSPSYYIAKMKMVDTGFNSVEEIPVLNISGDATTAKFKQVNLTSYYQVFLKAISDGGESESAIVHRLPIVSRTTHPTQIEKKDSFNTVLTFLAVAAAVVILGLLAIPMRHHKFSRKVSTTENKYETDDDKIQGQIEVSSRSDKWELSIESVNFKTVLGEGAFGVVWQAMLGNTPVACKTLKENCTADEVRQLQQEIEIMKYVGSHPNIVSMVGCITEDVPNGPILIVEYCSRGNLLNYLRTIFNNITTHYNSVQKTDFQEGSNDCTNKLYELNLDQYEEQITETDLISYGRQIAMGMEYLSSQKVLHRDLAARNILMCDDKRVKVSDFGLSRDVYMDSIYCKTSNGKLPVRWMALESLTHQIYTSQSDVWSFGILLWEIATLGAIPYAGVETHELLAMLKRGERMSKPALCSDKVYSIMLTCWKETASERPTFSALLSELEALLTTEIGYLELNTTI